MIRVIRILYRHRNYGKWECIGSYDDLRQATSDLDKYKRGTLGEAGDLKLVTELTKKWQVSRNERYKQNNNGE